MKPRRQVHSGIIIVWVDRFLSLLPSEATCLAMADIHPELLNVEGREFIKDKSWRGANWALTTIENTRYGIPHTLTGAIFFDLRQHGYRCVAIERLCRN